MRGRSSAIWPKMIRWPRRPDAQTSVLAGERASSLTSDGLGRRWRTINERPRACSLKEWRDHAVCASHLKGDCKENDKPKCQERHQASCDQSGTIASNKFRHSALHRVRQNEGKVHRVPREELTKKPGVHRRPGLGRIQGRPNGIVPYPSVITWTTADRFLRRAVPALPKPVELTRRGLTGQAPMREHSAG